MYDLSQEEKIKAMGKNFKVLLSLVGVNKYCRFIKKTKNELYNNITNNISVGWDGFQSSSDVLQFQKDLRNYLYINNKLFLLS